MASVSNWKIIGGMLDQPTLQPTSELPLLTAAVLISVDLLHIGFGTESFQVVNLHPHSRFDSHDAIAYAKILGYETNL